MGATDCGEAHAAITALNCRAGERETRNGQGTKAPSAATRETLHLFV